MAVLILHELEGSSVLLEMRDRVDLRLARRRRRKAPKAPPPG